MMPNDKKLCFTASKKGLSPLKKIVPGIPILYMVRNMYWIRRTYLIKIMKQFLILLFATSAIILTNCNDTKRMNETTTTSLTDISWSLTEVMGKPVVLAPDTKMIFVRFNSKENKLEGNGGCNSLFGKFELSGNDRIKMNVASTKMACEGTRMEIESNFFKVLTMADSYFIKGDTLQLFKAKMAPLAKFVLVHG
jgi:heat shock protein HslJ